MKHAAVAAVIYAFVLLALGFVLGTARVFVVAPHLGETIATLIELPVMLLAAFFACRCLLRRWQVPPALLARAVMALCFLALLLSLEMLLGLTLFGRTADAQWTTLTAPAGLIGLAGQFLAALFPLFIERRAPP